MQSRHTLFAIGCLNLILLVPGLALLSPARAPTLNARAIAGPMHLHWQRLEPTLDPAWPDQPRFTSDSAFRPVVAGAVVLITSSRHDCVTAVGLHSGEVRWRFITDGPVRFAPAVWNGRAYVGSDDGYLYCLNSDTGDLEWKVRGGPGDRRILGNERLISTWPVRGAPVVADESNGRATVYFAAGIWPFMGIFLHAVDARTGQTHWQNSGEGAIFIKQPHQTDAFAGIGPQGNLVVVGDRLLVPGGRSIPACYDRHTGKRLHYRLADVSKLGGGPDIVVAHDCYINGSGVFDLETGGFLGLVGEPVAATATTLFSVQGTSCRAFDLTSRPEPEPEPTDAKAKAKARTKKASEAWLPAPLALVKVPRTTALLSAHGRLYGAGPGVVYALALPLSRAPSTIVWQTPIQGTPLHLSASEDRLLVSTREGRLYAFGPELTNPRVHPRESTPLPVSKSAIAPFARKVKSIGVHEGYAVVWGIGDSQLIAELTRQSKLRLIVIDPDPRRVADLREELRRADVDGKQVSVLCATPLSAQLPPYHASLVIVQDLSTVGAEADNAFFDLIFHFLRPYGGIACLKLASHERKVLGTWLGSKSSEGQARVEEVEGLTIIRREGALPGAGDWTHQHADEANTRVSKDARVKAPLGVLWFGGPGNQGILPRHGHGPVPQVCEGRLLIEGPDKLRAIDIYTGRLLWETTLPGVGKVYDNTAHQPGANALGSNYVSTPKGIFVAYRDACLQLDLATGRLRKRYVLPPLPGQKASPEWTFLAVVDRYLVGGSGLVVPSTRSKSKKTKGSTGPSSSKRLTVLDRMTGATLFSVEARTGFRHNAICLGGGRLFAIDRTDGKDGKARLIAHDLRTGKRVWSQTKGIFGTWLSYSARHDVLVEAGLMSRDTLADEPEGMRAYRGYNGSPLWQNKDYFGPALIHGDRILKGGDARAGSGTACELLTGKPIRVPDPLTGQPTEWKWVRTYGCNTPAASEHLVLFRSGAAGFFDLCNDGGTGNLGGFRSSCTLNMIAAGGVLTVPDYTRTCTCSYQNQCSVGLIHMPEAELWTFTTSRPVAGLIRQVGVNFGAPGSRKADNGTLWLEYPPVGGPSPKLAIRTTPARPEIFRMHHSQVEGNGLRWVSASGVRGLSQLRIPLGTDRTGSKRYTVRLYFLEPDQVPIGARLFDVNVQGKTVLSRFDIRQQAGACGRMLVHECTNVVVTGELTITLTPCAGSQLPTTVLSGVEVLASES
jgi:outer membrane protein assembly factor BamB